MRLLVLANSYKLSNRCVAGIDLDTGKWIRPVGQLLDGSILEHKTAVRKNGRFVPIVPLDVVEFEVGQNRATPHHPEDVELRGPFSLIGNMSIAELRAKFPEVVQDEGPIFGDYSDRIPAAAVLSIGSHSSLMLMQVSRFGFDKTLNISGNPQFRGSWGERPKHVDLVITDPQFVHVRGSLSSGLIDGALVTISLGEELKGAHYKLIAAVLPLGQVNQQGSF
jgi:hypothetical protein